MEKINRRKAMSLMAKWSAASCIPFSWLMESCQKSGPSSLLSEDYQVLLSTIVEIILPKTPESPGAKEANVQHFVALIIEDCYEDEERNKIVLGLNTLLSKGFLNFTHQEQFNLINQLDQDASKDFTDRKKKEFDDNKTFIERYYTEQDTLLLQQNFLQN